ncbi:MAG: hypothetical protein MR373_00955, partial [Faecalibacterium prausnitzii]|nr:hypothetical protein [Faecalibacterium prausnitzii]
MQRPMPLCRRNIPPKEWKFRLLSPRRYIIIDTVDLQHEILRPSVAHRRTGALFCLKRDRKCQQKGAITMFKITEKVALNPTVTKMVIEAPLIAKK